MLRLLPFLTRRFLINLAGVVLLSLVIWYFGSLLSIFGWKPLGDPGVRALAALAPFLGLAVYELVRAWRIRRLNRRMVDSLLKTEGLPAEVDPVSEEEDILAERFEEAMEILRENAVEGRRGQRYVYELPWYLIIGPPGAGKTTILRNSGLDFPLIDHLGAEAIQGFGGTRNCDWWFTDEAVLIDTAGRYTTQDSNTAADRAAWRNFLDLLKRYRRRCPVNGILLAISLSDVILMDEDQRQAHVTALRARLQELMRAFGMRMPVYVLITKCDLMPGFTAFFDDLDEAGREQPFGVTFPEDVDRSPTAAARRFQREYDGLVGRVAQQLGRRLHEERSLERRRLIFGFTQELAELKPLVGSFVSDVFRETRYETPAWLRGVYFTSGTQQGAPVDRLLGSLSTSFGLSERALPAFSGRGKAFFIHKVLTDVVFREADLAAGDRRYERMVLAAQSSAAVAGAGLVFLLGTIWYTAYGLNSERAAELEAAIDRYRQIVQELPPYPDFETRLRVLEAADDIPAVFESGWLSPLFSQAGITAESRLAPLARDAADQILHQRMWRDLRAILGEQLQEALSIDADDTFIRESLRHYLMLAMPSRMNASSFRRWVSVELDRRFPLQSNLRQTFLGYLDRALDLGPLSIELDDGLVFRARSELVDVPLASQVYQSLQAEAATAGIESFSPGRFLRVSGRQVLGARSEFGLFGSIPGLYTARGFYDFFIPRLPEAARGEFRADWVLGNQANQASEAQIASIAREVARLYVRDYIQYWERALDEVQLVPFVGLPDALQSLETLSDPQSPLRAFLEAVERNTHLPQEQAEEPADQQNGGDQDGGGDPAEVVEAAFQGLADRTRSASAVEALQGNWPGDAISRNFQALHDLVRAPEGGTTRLDGIQDIIARVYGQLRSVSVAPDTQQAAFDMAKTRVQTGGGDAISDLTNRAVRTPEPVRSILLDASGYSWQLLMDEAKTHVQQHYRQVVLPECRDRIFRRYPVYADSSVDITVDDFTAFFGYGGIFETFYNDYLDPFVEEGRRGYRNAGLDGVSLDLEPNTLRQLRFAEGIKRNFFATAGGPPVLSFDLRPSYLDPGAQRALLEIGDQTLDYRHEPPRRLPFVWPPDSGEEFVSLTIVDLVDNRTRIREEGPWAFLRFLDRIEVTGSRRSDRVDLAAELNGLEVRYVMEMDSTLNAVTYTAVNEFRCPVQL